MLRRLRHMLEDSLGNGAGSPPAWAVSPQLRIVLLERDGVPVLQFENGVRQMQPLIFTEVQNEAQAEALVEYVRFLRERMRESVPV
jgi:hypothetical protein